MLSIPLCSEKYIRLISSNTTVYYYKQLYMFRASICPSSGVLGCIRIMYCVYYVGAEKYVGVKAKKVEVTHGEENVSGGVLMCLWW